MLVEWTQMYAASVNQQWVGLSTWWKLGLVLDYIHHKSYVWFELKWTRSTHANERAIKPVYGKYILMDEYGEDL